MVERKTQPVQIKVTVSEEAWISFVQVDEEFFLAEGARV